MLPTRSYPFCHGIVTAKQVRWFTKHRHRHSSTALSGSRGPSPLLPTRLFPVLPVQLLAPPPMQYLTSLILHLLFLFFHPENPRVLQDVQLATVPYHTEHLPVGSLQACNNCVHDSSIRISTWTSVHHFSVARSSQLLPRPFPLRSHWD